MGQAGPCLGRSPGALHSPPRRPGSETSAEEVASQMRTLQGLFLETACVPRLPPRAVPRTARGVCGARAGCGARRGLPR